MERDALILHLPNQESQTREGVNPMILRVPSEGADAPPPALSVGELAQDEARMQQFLMSNYHLLCNKIFMSLERFYPWLRNEGVFTIHDQQLVESTYSINLDKAGHLIDIITYNKGPKGFKAFMEVIEYEFPYVFAHIMGIKAGKPSPEYRGSIPEEGPIERRSRALWDQAMVDIQEATSKVTEEMIQKFKSVAERAQEAERMTLQSLQEEIATLKEEKASAERLAAKYLLERDERCASCLRYLQMKDNSNVKVVELRQEVTQLQRELSRLKSGQWEARTMDSDKKDFVLTEIRHLIEQHDSSQEHHNRELQQQLEQLKHERDHLYNVWVQEKGKREQAYIECSYYIEKARQLENEMQQLTDVAYTMPRTRACNLKDRKDLPSMINKKLATPTSEDALPVFDNNVDTTFVDFDNNWDELIRHSTHLLLRHPSLVETERSTFCQHPSITVNHRRADYLSRFPIQVVQKYLDTDLLLPRLPLQGSSMETVEVDADLLRQNIKLVGGSYTGIFVGDIGKGNGPNTRLTVGDQILKIGQSLQDMYTIEGMTLEHMLMLLRRFSGSVNLCKLSNITGLGRLHEAREKDKVIQGDCFCVIIKKPVIVVDTDWLPFERGSIVMVTETVHNASHDSKSCWFGVKLNPKNANLLQSGCLASELKSKRVPPTDSFDESSRGTLTRQGAVKCRISPYVYVQPYKACYQRPVVVFSRDDVRKPLHEALLKLSASFFPYQTDHLFRCEMDEVGEEMVNHLLSVASKRTQHLLLTVREEDVKYLHSAGIYPIVLLLQWVLPQSQTTAEKLQEEHLQKVFYRHEYELIAVDRSEAADMDRLAERLEKQVQMMQTDIIWVRCSKVTAPF